MKHFFECIESVSIFICSPCSRALALMQVQCELIRFVDLDITKVQMKRAFEDHYGGGSCVRKSLLHAQKNGYQILRCKYH